MRTSRPRGLGWASRLSPGSIILVAMATHADAARSRTLRGRIALALLAMAATLLLVELLMQAGALIVHYRSKKPAIDVGGVTDTILCVGDSWTHGMGSSDSSKQSYPAVLQELLRQRTGTPWTVVNGGQSGQNSRDVLLRLPSQLQACKPKCVLVLIGRNDMWSRPALVDDSTRLEDYQDYRFRWRLPRLYAWAMGALRGESPVAPKPPKVRGPEWDKRVIPYPTGYPGEKSIAAPVPAAAQFAKAGWAAAGNQKIEEALAAFEAAFQLAPEDPSLRAALVSMNARGGKKEAALAHLGWLRETWAATGNYWVGRSLVGALDAVNAHEEVRSVATAFLRKWPDEVMVRVNWAWAAFQLGDLDAAYAAVLRVQETWQGSFVFKIRAKVEQLRRRDADAIRSSFACYLATNDAPELDGNLNRLLEARRDLADLMHQELAAMDCPDDVRGRMQEVLLDCIEASDGRAQEAVLRRHWMQIAGHCLKHDAKVVFLTYPIVTPFGRLTVTFADACELPCIDVEAAFATKVGTARAKALRSPDGHVNDEGYRLMAEFVADDLVPLLTALR
jgi:lysophospholipase L1-like esterase